MCDSGWSEPAERAQQGSGSSIHFLDAKISLPVEVRQEGRLKSY
jgi:hypothetical protein